VAPVPAIAARDNGPYLQRPAAVCRAPSPLELHRIQARRQFAHVAARQGLESGFDGMENPRRNGYLIRPFLLTAAIAVPTPMGGPVENRARSSLKW